MGNCISLHAPPPYSTKTAAQDLFEQKLDALCLSIRQILRDANKSENVSPNTHFKPNGVREFLGFAAAYRPLTTHPPPYSEKRPEKSEFESELERIAVSMKALLDEAHDMENLAPAIWKGPEEVGTFLGRAIGQSEFIDGDGTFRLQGWKRGKQVMLYWR